MHEIVIQKSYIISNKIETRYSRIVTERGIEEIVVHILNKNSKFIQEFQYELMEDRLLSPIISAALAQKIVCFRRDRPFSTEFLATYNL